jgi:predicted small lipoprotein YifL
VIRVLVKKTILFLLLVTVIGGCGAKGAERLPMQSVQQSATPLPDSRTQTQSPAAATPDHTSSAGSPIPVRVGDQVQIYRVYGDELEGRLHGILKSEEAIRDFAEAVQTGGKMDGIMDVVPPQYQAVIKLDNKETSIYLWLDNEENNFGLFTYAPDTSQGYRLAPQTQTLLLNHIKSIHYTSEQAEKNGDIVFSFDGAKNLNTWTAFFENVKQGRKDAVQLTTYTTEGDPIFYNLDYDGREIRYQYDNTHDGWGAPKVEQNYCKALERIEDKQGYWIYTLTGCSDPERTEQPLNLYLP